MSSFTPINDKQLKTAIVYDWLNTPYGGAEQVLLALKKLFPDAPIYTSIYNPQRCGWASKFEVKTTFINSVPFFNKHHRLAMPFMPLAFESLNLDQYQLIISVTSALAKGVVTKADQLHVCYLLSPPRFLYDFKQQHLQTAAVLKLPIIKQLKKLILNYVRWWDQAAIYRPDVIIPLSKLVQQRAADIYQISTAAPIYPPLDAVPLTTSNIEAKTLNLPSQFLLVVSRLVPYKRVDLAIKACVKLNRNLVIVGAGPSKNKLQKLADRLQDQDKPLITFLPPQPQPIVNSLMSRAEALLSPGVDDFGLAPLQANFLGTPSVVNSSSGAAEVFNAQKQGAIMPETSCSALIKAVQQLSQHQFNSDKMKTLVQKYSTDKFLQELKKIISTLS